MWLDRSVCAAWKKRIKNAGISSSNRKRNKDSPSNPVTSPGRVHNKAVPINKDNNSLSNIKVSNKDLINRDRSKDNHKKVRSKILTRDRIRISNDLQGLIIRNKGGYGS